MCTVKAKIRAFLDDLYNIINQVQFPAFRALGVNFAGKLDKIVVIVFDVEHSLYFLSLVVINLQTLSVDAVNRFAYHPHSALPAVS